MPDLKKAVKQGIDDCEWDVYKPSGESKEANGIYHVIDRIERAHLFDKLPDPDIQQEYDAGRLAGARRSLVSRRVSSDTTGKSGTTQGPAARDTFDQVMEPVRSAAASEVIPVRKTSREMPDR